MTPPSPSLPDLVCLSHLRWDFVFQRPQHLMTRCARDRRTWFVEEPLYDAQEPHLETRTSSGVRVVVPHLPSGMASDDERMAMRELLHALFERECIFQYVLWYYTPMALRFSDDLAPVATVYDCMDELSGFRGAPASLIELDSELMRRATLVLTGGQSLFEARRHRHANIHPFPSSVDVPHFAQARQPTPDPPDQAVIARPRLGFFGVVDERMDLPLLDGIAAARPHWQFVLLGPVVKIDRAELPVRPNLHYLGMKTYEQLPQYLAGWDVALLPFARNEATRFISPTKTPEYLAAGKPVVSTSIRDVVRPYGQQGLVYVADDVDTFVDACAAAMNDNRSTRLTEADAFLRQTSWDGTWTRIRRLLDEAIAIGRTPGDKTAPSARAAG